MSTQENTPMVSAVIPFSGFYYSMHDDALDRAMESCIRDDQGEPVHPKITERLFDAINWQDAHEKYARAYVKTWCKLFGIVGVEFEELNSPREYNFTTDRLFVRIPAAEFARILATIPADELAKVAADMFTSRSGFISFYSPDVSSWGPAETWDHNQRLAALQALQNAADAPDIEWSIVEDYQCNGAIENWILNTPKTVRLVNLAYRVRQMRGEC